MHQSYPDITALTESKPQWWDEHGVPRYCDFHPRHVANIYADEACLLLIECQNCGAEFKVAMSRGLMQYARRACRLSELIKGGQIEYGDPPNAGCCGAGPTMNSIPRAVLKFWERGKASRWERNQAFEVEIKCDWENDG